MRSSQVSLCTLSLLLSSACYLGDDGASDSHAEEALEDDEQEFGEDPYLALADDPRVKSIVEDEGLPVHEALRRVRLQDRSHTVVPAVAEELADQYGGAWYDDETGRLVVGVVTSAELFTPAPANLVSIRSAGLDDDSDVVRVKWPLRQLDETAMALTNRLDEVNAEASAHLGVMVVPTTNSVTVTVPEGTLTPAQIQFIEEAQTTYGDQIVLQSIDGDGVIQTAACHTNDCNPPLRGGVEISGAGGCTLGFMARAKTDGRRFAITAAHCGASSGWSASLENNSWRKIGPTHKLSAAGKGDSMLIRVEDVSFWNPRPWVVVEGSAGTKYNPTYAITKRGGSVMGMRVCKTGWKTGTTCGKVIGLNAGGAPGWGGGYGISSMCSKAGDSGGPVYAGNTAFGIVHASTMSNSTCMTWYDGIGRVLATLTVDLL